MQEQKQRSEALWKTALEFAAGWIARRKGSPAEFVRELEEHAGWPVRHVVLEVLRHLRADRQLQDPERKFLNYTLGEAAIAAALCEHSVPPSPHQSSLDELFSRSRVFRRSNHFVKAVEFVSKFRDYSPFNNMLVYLQNPLTTYFATSSHWYKKFGRTIKDEARGMLILAPRTPVLLVYDVADTEGPKLPEKLELFSKVSGIFRPGTLEHTLKNAERDQIAVERKPMGQLRAGFATTRLHDERYKIRIAIRQELDDAGAYAALCHELAHVYLGHLGTNKEGWWPYRLNLSEAVAEIEAEAVSHTVCRRAGLITHSAEYLSNYIDDETSVHGVSLDLVSRVAGYIEEMGRRLLPPRKSKAADSPEPSF